VCTVASECPPADACVTPTCTSGCCGTTDAASGTACTATGDGGGKVCDGNGNCVGCLAPTDCPATGTVTSDNVTEL
jgi:hypothetical protein